MVLLHGTLKKPKKALEAEMTLARERLKAFRAEQQVQAKGKKKDAP